jgi:death-on-curing protein
LIQNHPFWDGNKRIATEALRLFIARNGAYLQADGLALRNFTTTIARGALRDGEIVVWMSDHIEQNDKA